MMKYSDINKGSFVDGVNNPNHKNYKVLSKDNGWVRVQHLFQRDLIFSARAKSLIDHDIVAAANRKRLGR